MSERADHLKKFGVYIKGHRRFQTEFAGLDQLNLFNVIVGRNNSGKSTFVGALADANRIPGDVTWEVSYLLSAEDLIKLAADWRSLESSVSDLIEKCRANRTMVIRAIFELRSNQLPSGSNLRYIEDYPSGAKQAPSKYLRAFLTELPHFPLNECRFFRISAERDIVAEEYLEIAELPRRRPFPGAEPTPIVLAEDGAGATNLFLNYWQSRRYRPEDFEMHLLRELNKIYHPDVEYKEIRGAYNGHQAEIALRVSSGPTLPLSAHGSGLKTVLLVLFKIWLEDPIEWARKTRLEPGAESEEWKKRVLLFEELENNLHPTLQRNLIRYLLDLSKSKGVMVFLSTHSSTSLDYLVRQPEVTVHSITSEGEKISIQRVIKHHHCVHLLDDLGIKASDLVQTNAVIWVEGPSDRLYIERCIELLSNEKLEEGLHYQLLMYGGSIRSHFTGADPLEDWDTEQIQLFLTNGHTIFTMDSDRTKSGDAVIANKQRILDEMNSRGALCWMTERSGDTRELLSP
jgi:putative ATP-dependent endonuclease of OLD family